MASIDLLLVTGLIYLLARVINDEKYWHDAPYPIHVVILLQYFGLALLIRLPVSRITVSTQRVFFGLSLLLLIFNTIIGCFWLNCIRLSDDKWELGKEYLVWATILIFIPISIAVSCLSPVSTQTLIWVSISFAIVSGTPYYNLSSIAVEPT